MAAAAVAVFVLMKADHGQLVGRQGASRVEPEPAEPQQRRADEGVGHVVRRRCDARNARPPADDQREHEGRDARRHVHDRASREVERSEVVQPPVLAPDPVRNRVIDQRRPQEGENDERRELDPLRERAGDERRRDDGEHHLEDHEELVGNGGRVVGVRRQADAVEAEPGQVPEQVSDVGAKGDAVAPQDPLDADEAEDEEGLHHRGQHVLPPTRPP